MYKMFDGSAWSEQAVFANTTTVLRSTPSAIVSFESRNYTGFQSISISVLLEDSRTIKKTSVPGTNICVADATVGTLTLCLEIGLRYTIGDGKEILQHRSVVDDNIVFCVQRRMLFKVDPRRNSEIEMKIRTFAAFVGEGEPTAPDDRSSEG
ncbi:hypothetical protein L596_028260 [Steinernema carpocapsae]|uniref:Uncharacterized protein n=1 Tax=Steinernema carpocapsae TaxID=34508 RepID=A0A4U5LXX6_STECR|nr:hypothetical protein L596_028260 [Steinernema carpocapsae]